MTSTTLSNKAFPKLFKWAFRRNRSTMVVFSVLMALGIFIDLYVMSTIMKDTSYNLSGLGISMDEEISSIGYASIIVAQVGAIVLAFISALATFSYLHNKRSTDMFGALPTTRETMYLSHLLGGFTAVSAPFIIGSFIVMGITCRSGNYLVFDLILILAGLLGIAASYTFTALIAYCCGTVLDTAIISLAVNAIYAGTVGLFWGMASEMIPGIEWESLVSVPVISLFAPFTFCFFADAYTVAETPSSVVFMLVWSVLFTAAMIAVGLYAAKKRKAEVAQSEFGVKWLPVVIKAGGSIVAGGLIGCIAALSTGSGYGNMLVFAFWYVIISFSAFFILHVIFQRGLKGKFLPSAIVYAATTVVMLAISFGMTFGLGMDTYVPAPSNVKKVTFGYTEFKDPENIETITEIHKTITEGVREYNDYPYHLGSIVNQYYYESYDAVYEDGLYDDVYSTSDVPSADGSGSLSEDKYERMRRDYPLISLSGFNFVYNKKVGFTTMRSYYLYTDQMDVYDYDKLESLLQKLYNSEEYKKSNNEFLWSEDKGGLKLSETPKIGYNVYTELPSAGSGMYYNSYGTGYTEMDSVDLPTGDNFMNGLYDALKKDILADNKYYETAFPSMAYESNAVFGDSYLTLTAHYTVKSGWKNHTGNPYFGGMYYDSGTTYVFAVIPDSYKNTLKYLEDNFIPTKCDASELIGSFMNAEDYIINNGEAAGDYYNFGTMGDYTSLRKLVEDLATPMEYVALIKSGVSDYTGWNEAHHEQFVNKLLDKASDLYAVYSKDPSYIQPQYTTQYLSDQGITGSFFYMADQIIVDLVVESESIVSGSLG